MEREKVDFTGAMQMMLVTLYGKAMESGFPDSLLKDRFAAEAVRWIDYDFPSLKVDSNMASGLAIRAKAMDEWVSGFLTRNPAATVVHLGCGMDTRVFRIDPPGEVEWFDVDYPEVVALRRRLYPARVHYHLVASPAAEFGWIEEVPRGPAVIVAEGLTPYLRPQEGLRLFSRLVAHCGQGELVCDVYGGFALKMMRLTPYFRRSGAELHWHTEIAEGAYPQAGLVIDCRGLGARTALTQLRGVRGEVARIHAPGIGLRRPVRLLHPRYPIYIAPKENDLYVIGATELESEDMSPMTVRSALELLSAAHSLNPAFGEARIVELNVNCRPALPDHLPRVQWDGARLMRVNGLYRHGYLLAPAVTGEACALAQALMQTTSAPSGQAFDWETWRASRPWPDLFRQA